VTGRCFQKNLPDAVNFSASRRGKGYSLSMFNKPPSRRSLQRVNVAMPALREARPAARQKTKSSPFEIVATITQTASLLVLI
jgi:hypothetical protein